jgi:hypothetical protein
VKLLSRRAFLGGAGGITIGLPLLESMTEQRARAAVSAAAKRLVIFFSPNATNNPAEFMPQQGGANYTLGKETAPLLPLRDKLLVVSGINMESAKQDDGDHHSIGMSHMLTATKWIPASGYEKPGGDQFTVGFAGGISVDQHIAKQIGTTTKFPSLEFGVISISDYGVHPFSRMISAGPNQPVPAEDDPGAMFKRVFTDGTIVAGTTVEQANAQRRSVLDFVTDDFVRLEAKLGTRDRQKVDQHLTAVRNLEARLSRATTPPSASCINKTFTPSGDPLDKANIPVTGKLQMDLLTLALSCDVTRVASIQWSWARSLLVHPWVQVGDQHHTLSHGGASDALSRINTWFSQQLAYLATSMNAIDEGNGQTLLDNSVVYWCGECAIGYNHDYNNIRAFLLGSCGGALKTGQHIHLENEPHNKLLVTLMNAMGVAGNQFGDPQFGTGPLPGVSAT